MRLREQKLLTQARVGDAPSRIYNQWVHISPAFKSFRKLCDASKGRGFALEDKKCWRKQGSGMRIPGSASIACTFTGFLNGNKKKGWATVYKDFSMISNSSSSCNDFWIFPDTPTSNFENFINLLAPAPKKCRKWVWNWKLRRKLNNLLQRRLWRAIGSAQVLNARINGCGS